MMRGKERLITSMPVKYSPCPASGHLSYACGKHVLHVHAARTVGLLFRNWAPPHSPLRPPCRTDLRSHHLLCHRLGTAAARPECITTCPRCGITVIIGPRIDHDGILLASVHVILSHLLDEDISRRSSLPLFPSLLSHSAMSIESTTVSGGHIFSNSSPSSTHHIYSLCSRPPRTPSTTTCRTHLSHTPSINQHAPSVRTW